MTCPDCRRHTAKRHGQRWQCDHCGHMGSDAIEGANALPPAGTFIHVDDRENAIELDGMTEVKVKCAGPHKVVLHSPRWPEPGWDEERYVWAEDWECRWQEDYEAKPTQLPEPMAGAAS